MVSEKVEVLPAGRHLVLGYFSLVTPGEATPDVPAVLKVTSLNYTVLEYNEREQQSGLHYI